MRRKITFLIAALGMLLGMIYLPEKMVGQSKGYTELFTIESGDVVNNSGYTTYTATIENRGYVITFGGNNKSVGTSSKQRSNCKLGDTYSKYAVSPVTSSQTASAFVTTTSISNISKISYKHNGGSNDSDTKVYLVYSSDNNAFSQMSLISGSQGASIDNGSYVNFEFNSCSGYFGLLFEATNTSGNWRIDDVEIKFYTTTYTITYDANGATKGSVPDATTHDAGSDATVANNTGSLVRTGFMFSGWNTQTDGEGTDYAEGATINNIAQDYTLYAKWTSASTPNIVVSGDDISNNALNLVYTESGDKTATASYNNMPSGYSNAEVALYNDLECTEAFGGDWFSASLNESDKTEIDYSANANIGVARTVYMRVSAVYDEITYYSNVITVTQAALPCTVTYNKNDEGASGTMSDGDSPYAYGSTVTVLANGFTAPTGKVFYKWNTKADASGQWYEANDTFEITENTTLYAQWSNIPTYTLVTSVSEITPGAHYIMVGTTNNGAWSMGAQTGSNTYRDADVITDGITVDGQVIQAGLQEFVISGPVSSESLLYTIYDESQKNTHYLNANGGTNNNSINVISTIGNTSQWTIAWGENDKAIITANFTGNDARNLLSFNSSANPKRFTCYKAEQSAVYLFKKDNDTDIHPYSPTTYDEDVTINDVTITPSNKITVSDGATVTLTGTVSCDDPANLVIEDGGQLITNSCIPLTYKKNITSATKDGGWYTISTPVHTSSNTFLEHESVENLILAPEQYDFFYYDEPSHYWRNYKKHGFDLNVGQGYLYRNNGAELHFAGNNNQATYYEKDLSYASTEPSLLGFNLIGNPYPQNITMSDVTVNNEGTLTGGYVLSNAGAWSADVAATIAPAQGFLVQIDKAGVTARITKPTGGSKSRTNHDYLKFIVANSQYEDAAFALFDKGYGLNKIDHRNADIPMLYIPKDKQNFAIATMSDDTKSFNLNFKAMTTGKYTLSYKATGTYSYLHVIDRLTGEDVDMLLEGEYSFIASPSDAENRFIVRLEYSAGSESPESSVFAYQSGNDIIVNGEGELQIFDMMGRRVSTQYVSGVETINLQLSGVYVFRLNDKTQKIVVK